MKMPFEEFEAAPMVLDHGLAIDEDDWRAVATGADDAAAGIAR